MQNIKEILSEKKRKAKAVIDKQRLTTHKVQKLSARYENESLQNWQKELNDVELRLTQQPSRVERSFKIKSSFVTRSQVSLSPDEDRSISDFLTKFESKMAHGQQRAEQWQNS